MTSSHGHGATPALMVQGTSSHAGKSLLVAGLCRGFSRAGLNVRPFKPQNMSNNAAVTLDQGEIGRAQALQARAAETEPSKHMNPVLLKPQTGSGAQLVVQGEVIGNVDARDYHRIKSELLSPVLKSFFILSGDADLILVEGAGSPAEVNLRTGDFANMGFALAANVPAVLVGDIERGGVIAAIVGTMELLEKEERACLKGYIINKFRGDPSLFGNAHPVIQGRTGLPALGVVPWFDEASKLPEEDVLGLTKYRSDDQGSLRVAVPRLPRISNLDDLDPLLVEPDVSLVIVNAGEALPVCDLVMLIGSKATIADMASLRENGWDIDIRAHVRRSGHVIGLCGGYQMLGRTIADPDRIEGTQDHIDGLGLLDVETILRGPKTLLNSGGQDTAYRTEVQGYQIHMGETFGPDTARPLLRLGGVPDGAVSANGRVAGCYLHGLFTNDDFRRAYLGSIRNFAPSSDEFEASVDGVLNDLADHLEAHLDLDRLYEIAASRKNNSA